MIPFDPGVLPLSAADSIADNILPIILILAVGVVLLGVLWVVNLWDKHRNRIKLDELEAKMEKLKRYANYQKRRSLKDAITMLDPGEREHLYRIWEDNAVVSRKTLFKLNELEDRLRRAERGAELRWAESRIMDVSESERRLFPDHFPPEKRRRRK